MCWCPWNGNLSHEMFANQYNNCTGKIETLFLIDFKQHALPQIHKANI